MKRMYAKKCCGQHMLETIQEALECNNKETNGCGGWPGSEACFSSEEIYEGKCISVWALEFAFGDYTFV